MAAGAPGREADSPEAVTSPQLTPPARPRAADAEPMYNPTPEQADADRLKAYQTGVPHGVCTTLWSACSCPPPCHPTAPHTRTPPRLPAQGFVKPGNKYAGQATIKLLVRSELVRLQKHTESPPGRGLQFGWLTLPAARRVCLLPPPPAASRRGVWRAVLGGGEPQDEG